MANLKIIEQVTDNEHILRMTGRIDEESEFGKITVDQKDIIVIDMKEISGMNSCGIREWVDFVKKIPANAKIYFLNCTQKIIDQANMIEGFFPKNSFVKSFFIPYYCESCSENTNILVTRENKEDAVKHEESIECHNCKQEAEIDVFAKKYFRFLNKF